MSEINLEQIDEEVRVFAEVHPFPHEFEEMGHSVTVHTVSFPGGEEATTLTMRGENYWELCVSSHGDEIAHFGTRIYERTPDGSLRVRSNAEPEELPTSSMEIRRLFLALTEAIMYIQTPDYVHESALPERSDNE